MAASTWNSDNVTVPDDVADQHECAGPWSLINRHCPDLALYTLAPLREAVYREHR